MHKIHDENEKHCFLGIKLSFLGFDIDFHWRESYFLNAIYNIE